MALKLKITAIAYDALPDNVKAEYKKDGDVYVLDIDGYEDPVELRRARDREKQAKAEAEKKLREIQEAQERERETGLKNSGDIENLTRKYEADRLKASEAHQVEIDKLQKASQALANRLGQSALDGQANALAAEIFVNSSRDSRWIKDRMGFKYDDDTGEVTVFIKDKQGQPSNMTSDDLKKEMLANKDFADIMIASKASGGARSEANGQNSSGGAANQNSEKPDLSRLNPQEMIAHIQTMKQDEG